MNVGILGGTFDPIHIGHLIAAEEARVQLNLDEVLFIPAGQPWLKSNKEIVAISHRVEMVRRAISDNKHFKLSTVEVDRPGDSYSVDTMKSLRRLYGDKAELFFIIGQDSLQTFPKWKSPESLIKLCRLVVMDRPQAPPLGMTLLEQAVPGITQRLIQLHMPWIGVSSTDIREHVARDRSIHYLVPPGVEEYIELHRLYRD
jgi:nicotinate-nucleotide adenylyltransferase